ncbi:MAG: signal recognition particle protein, partial [Desulfuromonadales bacterium]|nr:signal recognition particle protein [Desulfuromonadales bacterium]
LPEKELQKVEAIINSMTRKERYDHRILNGSRRQRIARGSGTSVQDVNQLIKRFMEAQKMMKKMQKLGPKGLKNLVGSGRMPF